MCDVVVYISNPSVWEAESRGPFYSSSQPDTGFHLRLNSVTNPPTKSIKQLFLSVASSVTRQEIQGQDASDSICRTYRQLASLPLLVCQSSLLSAVPHCIQSVPHSVCPVLTNLYSGSPWAYAALIPRCQVSGSHQVSRIPSRLFRRRPGDERTRAFEPSDHNSQHA